MTSSPPNLDFTHIAIIGLGYVGLPLAVEFGKHYHTVGFDINAARIEALQGRAATARSKSTPMNWPAHRS